MNLTEEGQYNGERKDKKKKERTEQVRGDGGKEKGGNEGWQKWSRDHVDANKGSKYRCYHYSISSR